jgi:hypothetical protein
MKIKQVQKILKSNLQLLVLLRESLAASGAIGTPLYEAVAAQAQVTGMALPNTMRMTPEEIKTIRRQSVAAALPAPEAKSAIVKPGEVPPALPAAGGFMILNPNQIKK